MTNKNNNIILIIRNICWRITVSYNWWYITEIFRTFRRNWRSCCMCFDCLSGRKL